MTKRLKTLLLRIVLRALYLGLAAVAGQLVSMAYSSEFLRIDPVALTNFAITFVATYFSCVLVEILVREIRVKKIKVLKAIGFALLATIGSMVIAGFSLAELVILAVKTGSVILMGFCVVTFLVLESAMALLFDRSKKQFAICIAVVFVITAITSYYFYNEMITNQDSKKAAITMASINSTKAAVLDFKIECQRLPLSVEELTTPPENCQFAPLIEEAVTDGFGRALQIGVRNDKMTVYSLGADGKEGGVGPDMDFVEEIDAP